MEIPNTCECGCGAETAIATRSDRRNGQIKGRPLRFVQGHNNRHLFGEGEQNVRWRGDDAGVSAIHKWINKIKPLTRTCEECGATGMRTEWSNLDHTWRRDPDDYRELCSRCHRHYDHDELGQYNPLLDRNAA